MKLNSDYWEERYQNNETGWNVGEITLPLKEYIDQINDKAIRILIPGAGNGYELEYLIQKGFENSYVVDFATTPLENIQKRLPNLDRGHLIQSDFFDLEGQYDLILEQTFFCAIDPELRKSYVQKIKSLLKPTGKLAGLLFQFPLTEVGPPFGGSIEEYKNLFKNDFTIKTIETAYNSIKPRKENELFFIFEKK
ncbi:methyltransferase domain-containing protein [Flavobacterium sp. GT3R68]|nr:methyltransferase domain-containing protein [Flavobacterium sp. GSN2]TRW89483.1 methyltransferase domain-containing protein [Flavobacterium sp. GT3R68]